MRDHSVKSKGAKQKALEHRQVRTTLGRQMIEVLSAALALPGPWVWGCLFLIVLSIVSVTWNQAHGLSVVVGLTALTATVLAIVWLPAIIRLLALLGGEAKTPIGSLSTNGLLPLLQSLSTEAIGLLVQEATQAQELGNDDQPGGGTGGPGSEVILESLKNVYAARLPSTDMERQLERLQGLYQQTLDPRSGPGLRPIFPTELINELQATLAGGIQVVLRQLGYTPQRVQGWLSSKSESDRLTGAIAATAMPDPGNWTPLSRMVVSPQSMVERFYALRAVEAMADQIPDWQKSDVESTIRAIMALDSRNRVVPNSVESAICHRILKAVANRSDTLVQHNRLYNYSS